MTLDTRVRIPATLDHVIEAQVLAAVEQHRFQIEQLAHAAGINLGVIDVNGVSYPARLSMLIDLGGLATTPTSKINGNGNGRGPVVALVKGADGHVDPAMPFGLGPDGIALAPFGVKSDGFPRLTAGGRPTGRGTDARRKAENARKSRERRAAASAAAQRATPGN